MPTALDYAKELVAFDSVSSRSNADVSDYVERALKALGFQVERLEYLDAAGVKKVNIVGKRAAGSGRGGLAYFAHTDVVPAGDWALEHGPFTPTVRDGRLYGRGSCDMKGSIACMLAAVESLPRDGCGPIYVTCTADEEVGFHGAREVAARSQLYREMVAAQVPGIIGEPTRLEVVHGHKAVAGFKAIARGRAAHSSTNAGINANLAMIPFLVEMKAMHDELQSDPAWRNEAFDPPTVSWNIGINDHNPAVNITAPQSVCTVYFRTMPGQDGGSLMERARAAAERCGLEFSTMWCGDALWVDPASPFVREVLRLAERTASRTVSYGTDGAMLTAMKKLVVIGPGDLAQAHTHDEWIALEQLEAGTRLYRRLIEHFCG